MNGMFSIILLVLMALLIPGIINRVRAVLAGRRGVTLYQHINNVELLLRKGAVYSPTTTLLFRVAPSVYLASVLVAVCMLPMGYMDALISFRGDVVLFCYLLAGGRMALILAAMDTGSSFEGMGASREALYGALVEPVMFVVAGTLALVTGHTSFAGMFANLGGVNTEMIIVMLLLAFVLYRVMTVEMGRVPVDDPRTHLELTMIHEVMVLDYCGLDLGFINIAGWFKGAAIALLAGNAVATVFSNSVLAVLATMVVMALCVGFTESFMARNRLSRNTTYILSILAVALLLFFVAFMLVKNISFE